MSKYTEQQISNWIRCHLYDPMEMAGDYRAAISTFRWALLELSSKKELDKTHLTTKYEKEISKHFKVKDQSYWRAIRNGRRFISKFIVLFRKYAVVHPIQTYSYMISGHTIEGEYALIQKKNENEVPLVLNILSNRPLHFQLPNILSSLRWLNSKNDFLNTGVYNFCLFRGDDWKIKDINEPLVSNWIHAIIREINTVLSYPTSGTYCATCESKRCLKDYYVRQNDNRW